MHVSTQVKYQSLAKMKLIKKVCPLNKLGFHAAFLRFSGNNKLFSPRLQRWFGCYSGEKKNQTLTFTKSGFFFFLSFSSIFRVVRKNLKWSIVPQSAHTFCAKFLESQVLGDVFLSANCWYLLSGLCREKARTIYLDIGTHALLQ